jgi:hypothetical protein
VSLCCAVMNFESFAGRFIKCYDMDFLKAEQYASFPFPRFKREA